MRLFGLTVTKDPKPVPAPPTRFCTCDTVLHLCRSASLARDILLCLLLWNMIHQVR